MRKYNDKKHVKSYIVKKNRGERESEGERADERKHACKVRTFAVIAKQIKEQMNEVEVKRIWCGADKWHSVKQGNEKERETERERESIKWGAQKLYSKHDVLT